MKFNLSSEFTMMDEGIYDFVIDNIEVKSDAEYGNQDVVITFKTNDGKSHREFYSLMKGNNFNEYTQRNLSRLYNAAMNSELYEQEVDFESIKGQHIIANIEHQEYTARNGELKKAAHIRNYQPSDEAVNQVVEKPKTVVNSLEDLFS